MKKILIIHNRYQNIGGEDTAVEQEINLLKEEYKVKVLYFENSIKNVVQQGYSFIRNSNSQSGKILKKALDDFKPDIAYVHNTWFKASTEIFNVLQREDIEILLKIHNLRFDCTRSFLLSRHLRGESFCGACGLKRRKRQIFNKYFSESYLKSFFVIMYGKSYYKVIANSKIKLLVLTNFHKNYLKKLSIDPEKIFIFPNYLKLSDGNADVKNKNLLYAGRVSEEKGVRELIKAFNKSSLNGFSLTIAGTGPLYETLKKKYPEIIFLGEVSNLKVLDMISKSAAVITATKLYEGQPMLLCEASTMSTPSIFPETGGISEFFPSEYSLSFQQFNYQDLIKKISSVDSDTNLAEIGLANKEHVSKMLSKKTFFDTFENILND